MELALKQENPADPVMLATSFLESRAVDWRDLDFVPTHGAANVPWPVFESAFLKRFIPQTACMDALASFNEICMSQHQSVQDFNVVFKQRRFELHGLPYISVPDNISQCNTYLIALTPAMRTGIEHRTDSDEYNDLEHLMSTACTAEKAAKQMNRVDNSAVKCKSHTEDHAHATQKRNHTSSTGGPSTPSSNTAARNGKNKQKKSRQAPAATGAHDKVPYLSQHVGKELPGSKGAPSSDEAKALHAKAKALSVKGEDGRMYPNFDYRMYAKRDCLANNRCFGCLQPRESHPAGSCPNPQVKSFGKKTEHVQQHTMPKQPAVVMHQVVKHRPVSNARMLQLTSHARQSLPKQASQGHRPLSNHCTDTTPLSTAAAAELPASAMLNARPYCGMTMLFCGAVQAEGQQVKQQSVNVLVDTGSTHNVCRPGLLKKGTNGVVYSVAAPGSQSRLTAPEGQLEFEVQGVTCNVNACEMDLPSGVDILLGQSWQLPHKAVLLTWQGQVNFMDDSNFPAVWSKPAELETDPFDNNYKWSSPAAMKKGNYVEQADTPLRSKPQANNQHRASAPALHQQRTGMHQ